MGGLAFSTSSSGNATLGYYAYGPGAHWARTWSGSTPTRYQFTGQYIDDTSLYYMNARYYDPEIGQFISPDTLVPDPANLLDYNRYAYARLNPMRYTDPTGHCANATTPNGSDSLDYDNEECWRLANTIANLWDSTDYWQNRFTSKEIFLNHVANNAHNGADFFQAQMDFFLNSDEGNAWLDSVPIVQRPEQDFGDYVAVTYGAGFAPVGISEVSIIVDQYGNIYMRLGSSVNTRGFSASIGDVLVNTSADGGLSGQRIDIDRLNVSRAEKVQLMKGTLTGHSASASGTWRVGPGVSIGLQAPYNVTAEAVIGAPGVSVSPWSYTFLIREAK